MEPPIRSFSTVLSTLRGRHIAEDGEEALRFFQQEKVDLVLADINMLHMEGLELMIAIRDLNPTVPIVLITGYDISSRQGKAAAERADGLVVRPLNILDLQDFLEKLRGT